MPDISFGPASAADIPAILEIQETNHVSRLTPESRHDGFLSARFTAAQLEALIGDLGIFVARDPERRIQGFMCAFQGSFAHGSPVIEQMIAASRHAHFREQPIDASRIFYYGPVCIEQSRRGQGLLPGLYETLKDALRERFDLGIAFIARNNARSRRAHVDKLGMTLIGEFAVGENHYDLLAFALVAQTATGIDLANGHRVP